jgi:Rps23 Pro-64 3,4-dihydroxylase Tpa1-like proline 4-hydroxylase
MEHPATRKRIESVLNVSLQPRMGDYFTSLYRKGNFLTAHSDAYGGTWAAVAYFCEGPTQGGTLSFFCQSSQSWCRTVQPAANRLVLFRTRHPDGPLHRVDPVLSDDTFFRWGGTGWYDEVGDVLSAHEARERDKMRNPQN